MSLRLAIRPVLILLLTSRFALGAVVRVPSDAPSIQLALNSILFGDTISVAPGTYVESLTAPPIGFSIFGETRIDSTSENWVTIDPSDLSGSDTLGCLTLTGGDSVFLRDIYFRNRAPMLEGREFPNWGGITDCDRISALLLKRCQFDSTFLGIVSCNHVVLDSCCFRNCTYSCVTTVNFTGRVTAENTFFESAYGPVLDARMGSSFIKCRFIQYDPQVPMWMQGDSISIHECHFGPSAATLGTMLSVRPRSGTLIADNVFEDCTADQGILSITEVCSLMTGLGFEGAIVERNRFVRCGGAQSGGSAIRVGCSDGLFGHSGEPAYLNHIEVCSSLVSENSFAAGIVCRATCRIDSSDFCGILPSHSKIISTASHADEDTVFIRNCSFESNQYGVYVEPQFMTHADARWNWWGADSGPYHFLFNPGGRGAEVSNDVEFDPWLLDTTDVAVEPPSLQPDRITISSFPNPFNAETTLRISIPRDGEYALSLYNIAGQFLRTLEESNMIGIREVRFDASALPSGAYFARLTDMSTGKELASTKLILLK